MGWTRWRSGAWRGWVLLGGAVVLGVSTGAVATVWVSGPAAAAVGSVIAAAVFGAVSARGRALLEQRAEQRDAFPRHVLSAGGSGQLRRVRELDDPIALGVHPAEMVIRVMGGQVITDRVPPYVPRDIQQQLRELVAGGGFVLLVGDSTAGKTRAAYEAVRALLPDHVLVAPAGRQSLAAIVPAVEEQRRCVVWLDDLERFLGGDGLTVNIVDRLRGAGERDALVLATMRSAEFDRYSAREETGIAGAERDSWRDARDVLELATVVELRRTWSVEELERARAYTDDSRIRAVLPKAGQLGVAELLAAGPELARDWRNAWRAGAHPRGAALVTAAVDCRRAGLHEPQPTKLLTRLAEQYLRDHGGALLRPESYAEALKWATASSHGASSLLLPTDRPEHYLALDYLIDLPWLDSIPPSTWHTLIDHATPLQVFDVGDAASQRAQHLIAISAYQKAHQHRIPGADISLVRARGHAYGPAMAARELADLLAKAEQAPNADRTCIHIRQHLAAFAQWAGDHVQAAEVAAVLIGDLERTVGAELPPRSWRHGL
jgi:eukaryotic-like serine/threonine-protein kinase